MTSYGDKVKIHAVLMLLGWGFFIPVALFTRSHLSRRSYAHDEFGVHFHMALSAIGLALSLAGFGYGIKNFNTLEQKGVGERTDQYEYAHAVIGTLATAGSVLQLLLMAIMRKPKDENDTFSVWPMWRKIGHVSHRACGFISLYLALVCMEMGTHLSSSRAQKYSAALIGTLTAAVLVIILTVRFAISKYDDKRSQRVANIHQVKIDLKEEEEEEESIQAEEKV